VWTLIANASALKIKALWNNKARARICPGRFLIGNPAVADHGVVSHKS